MKIDFPLFVRFQAIEVEFRANGNVGVVSGHHTLGYCLDNWHGRTYEGNRQHVSTWYRTHGTHDALRFTFNNDDGTVSPLNALGMLLASAGVACYSHASRAAPRRARADDEAALLESGDDAGGAAV